MSCIVMWLWYVVGEGLFRGLLNFLEKKESNTLGYSAVQLQKGSHPLSTECPIVICYRMRRIDRWPGKCKGL